MKYNSEIDLMRRLEREVRKTVKHYKSDFYEHDMKSIREYPESQFLWMTRECGTWMFVLDSDWNHNASKWLKAVIGQNYKVHDWFLFSVADREIRKLDDETVNRFSDRIFSVTEKAERMEIPVSKAEVEFEVRSLKSKPGKRRAA